MEEIIEKIIRKELEELFKRIQKGEWLTRDQIQEEFGFRRKAIENMEANGLQFVDTKPRRYNRGDLNAYLHGQKTSIN